MFYDTHTLSQKSHTEGTSDNSRQRQLPSASQQPQAASSQLLHGAPPALLLLRCREGAN